MKLHIDDDLPAVRRKFNRIIDDEIAVCLRQAKKTTLEEVYGRVIGRAGTLLDKLKAALADAELRTLISRRLKHGLCDDVDAPNIQETFEGMEDWFILERLTWENERGEVVYCAWLDSLETDRENARQYKKACIERDEQSYRDYCVKHDRTKRLVEMYGDRPLRELLELWRNEQQQARNN